MRVFRGQTYRPFTVVIEYQKETYEIEQVHNFWLQCAKLYACVSTVNTTDKYLGRTREEAIFHVIAYSFPLLQNPDNYRGWPIFVEHLLGYRLVLKDFNIAETMQHRDFFANNGKGSSRGSHSS